MNSKKYSTDFLQQCRSAMAAEQADSLAKTNNWSHVNKDQVHADWDALYQKLAPLVEHHSSDSPEIQSLIGEHFSIISRFYKPSKMGYIGTSLHYAENESMKNFHNSYHPKLVQFLAEAIPVYAEKHL